MNIPETFVAHYLNLTDRHQLADLKPMVVCPDYVNLDDEGCLLFADSKEHIVDGYGHLDGGFHLPLLVECKDRIHAMHFDKGEVALQLWCMSPQSDHFNSIVKCDTCETCPVRRGRE